MKILSIETSCDETAVSVVEASGEVNSPSFKVLGNALYSQIAIHKEYGGVYPMLAKREHAKNLPPITQKALTEAGMFILCDISHDITPKENEKRWQEIKEIVSREDGLYEGMKIFENIKKPEVDFIAVTSGPGLEPALWVGISFAQALSKLWDIPVISVNHMEGHIASVLINDNKETNEIKFPAIAVLISGGHTEIVMIERWGEYKIIGRTVDDAVGEAFDKTARLLGLPYPGGPEISRLAQYARENKIPHKAKLPRPMLHSDNLNFSFSGLKTAVLYYIRDNWKETTPSEEEKADLAREFEDSVVEVLMNKTKKALDQYVAKTLIVAGGVIANKKLREDFMEFQKTHNTEVRVPERSLSTDNSIMIAYAGYIESLLHKERVKIDQQIRANGNLELQ